MSTENIEHELANHNVLIRDLADKVAALKMERRPSGLVIPGGNTLPGPGAAVVSRTEFNRMRDGLVAEIEALKAELATISDVAFEAVRILDRIAGMED